MSSNPAGAASSSPQPTNAFDPAVRRRNQRTLLLIAAICVLPLLAALYYRFVAPPPRVDTVGALLTPTPFPISALLDANGAALDTARLDGHWLMLQSAPAACANDCQQAFYLSRQVRTAQAKHAERITRLWLLASNGTPNADVLAAHPDLVPVQLATAPPMDLIPNAVYLIDRRGFVVFRYAPDVDPVAFIKELGKLVKF